MPSYGQSRRVVRENNHGATLAAHEEAIQGLERNMTTLTRAVSELASEVRKGRSTNWTVVIAAAGFFLSVAAICGAWVWQNQTAANDRIRLVEERQFNVATTLAARGEKIMELEQELDLIHREGSPITHGRLTALEKSVSILEARQK